MTNIPLTIVGLALGLLLVSLDQTILATAVPTIVAELGGMEQITWVYSAYLIASVAGMPLFGKLSDMYGRKKFFLFGIIVFMIGSALCGIASSMTELIVFRAIQGIGGGALMPVIFTILFDIFPAEKRAKITGLFGAVFGLSSLLGPLTGALLTDYLDWSWIFFINLPLGVVSLFLVVFSYRDSFSFQKQKIDWAGTVTLVSSILSLMFAIELGGNGSYAWTSPLILGLFLLSLVLFISFLWIETKVQDPIVPLYLFKKRLFTSSMFISLLYGMLLMAGGIFIPLFVQGVIGGTATSSGNVLTPMMLALVLSSVLGGFFIRTRSFRTVMLVSALFLTVSIGLLSTLSPETLNWQVICYMILMGLGIGASFPVTSIAAQHKIEYDQRGVVNSLVRFFQTLGNTLGITLLGSFQSAYLIKQYATMLPDAQMAEQFGNPQVLLQEDVRAAIPAELLTDLLHVLSDSIQMVFQWSLPLCIIAIVFILLMGNVKMIAKR